MVSDKALAVQLCGKRIPTKMESSEASRVFIRRKESKVHVHRHTGWTLESVPESGPRGSLSYYYGAFLMVFL